MTGPAESVRKTSWERRIVTPIVRHRTAVLGALAVVTLLAATGLPRLEFESSIEVWFVEDDPDLVGYHAFLERFEADEVLVVALFAEDVFTPRMLGQIHAISEAIRQRAPYVHRVRSMTHEDVPELLVGADGEKTIAIGPVVPPPPLSTAQAAAARQRALDHRFVVDNFVSSAGDAAAIIVEIDRSAESITEKRELIATLQAIVEEVGDGRLDYEIAGGAVLDKGFFDYSERDFLFLGPVAIALVLCATFFVFRRLTAALVPLAVVLVACIWMFGLMGWLDHRIDVLSSGLVVLVMAVGIADTVHVLAEYDRVLLMGATPREAVEASLSELLVPCMFTSLTTAAGLLSLAVSGLVPVAWFGGLAAFGVTAAFVLSVTLVPAILQRVRPPSKTYVASRSQGVTARLLEVLGRPGRGRQLGTLAVSGCLAVSASYGVTQLQIGSNPMNYFLEGDPIRTATMRVDEALGGSTTIEFLVEAPNRGLTDPARLERLADLESRILALPAVARVDSLLDMVREQHRLWTDGRPESAVIPDSPRKVVQLLAQLEGTSWFPANITDDYSTGRFTARVAMSEAGALSKRTPELEAELRRDFHDETLVVSATGFVKLMGNMEVYLLRSQIDSMLLAALVVTLMIMVLLRSVRLALFSMIPNILPILMGLGFMAAMGIALDPGTVMIGSMALGLVVDDTVHFLVRLKRNLGHTPSLEEAIAWSMHQTGRPIIVTSVVLAVSFLVLAFGSSFAPNVYFGWVSALVIMLALIADLMLLPAALLTMRPRLRVAPSEEVRS